MYDGYSLPTNKVPSECDTNIIYDTVIVHFQHCYKFTPWIGIPTSKLFLQVVDVPQFKDTKMDLDHLTKRGIHNSKTSTTAVAYFDIWDTASSACTCQLIDKQLMFRGCSLWIWACSKSSGILLCTWCWKQGHPIGCCYTLATKCPQCSSPHKLEKHCTVAPCCKSNPKANPPQALMLMGEPCPHTFTV
ncbi:hypothetical protein CVT25_008509 [Psilocybe cyanescens]|uniref:Uncharacterized protein n=1 Tax=Psilocybe cyanescens TaxID=93625 RepID=A0A409XNM9_PSICY|nr:hypothetical protein CVT25_008509 [Psilocybe cyanescens]